MAGWWRGIEFAITDEKIEKLKALSRSRTEPASRVSRAQMLLAYRENPSFSWGSPSNGSALRGAGAGLWAAGGDRRSATAGQRTGHHAGGQSLVGVAGVRQGQGARLCALAVDDAAFGTSRTRARPAGGARMSRQAGSRQGVQDPRPGGNQAAQGALLSGTSRCRVRAEDGRGSVRLSRGPGSEESRRQVAQSHQASGDRFLRRKAGNPGHRNHSTRFAAQARRPRDVRAGLRVQTSWPAEPVGRKRPAYREGPCAR